jgi:hypothetical protein
VLVGTAGIGAITAVATTFAKVGDEVNKASQRIGVGVEQLAGLKYAAEQSGAGLETLEGGFRRMSRVINDAKDGLGEAQRTLESLGVTLSDLQGLRPDQQFKLMADRLSRVSDATTKAALAQELFGRSGTQLLPLIRDGARGIEELEQRQRRLGIVFRRDAAEAATDFGDALKDVGDQLKFVAFEAGAVVARAIRPYIDRVQEILRFTIDWVRQNGELIITFGKVSAAILGVGVASVVLGKTIALVGGLTVAVKGLSSAMVFLSAHPIVALVSALGLLTATLIGTELVMDSLRAKTIDLAKETKRLIDLGVPADQLKQARQQLEIEEQLARLRERQAQLQQINEKRASGGGETRGERLALAAGTRRGESENVAAQISALEARLRALQVAGAPIDATAESLATVRAELDKLNDSARRSELDAEEQAVLRVNDAMQEQLALVNQLIAAERNRVAPNANDVARLEIEKQQIIRRSEAEISRIRIEAARERRRAEEARPIFGPFLSDLEEVIDRIETAVEQAISIEATPAGIFNARALQSLFVSGSGSPAERTAKAVEKSEKHLGDIKRSIVPRFV